jgi:hypothetical protein
MQHKNEYSSDRIQMDQQQNKNGAAIEHVGKYQSTAKLKKTSQKRSADEGVKDAPAVQIGPLQGCLSRQWCLPCMSTCTVVEG